MMIIWCYYLKAAAFIAFKMRTLWGHEYGCQQLLLRATSEGVLSYVYSATSISSLQLYQLYNYNSVCCFLSTGLYWCTQECSPPKSSGSERGSACCSLKLELLCATCPPSQQQWQETADSEYTFLCNAGWLWKLTAGHSSTQSLWVCCFFPFLLAWWTSCTQQLQFQAATS